MAKIQGADGLKAALEKGRSPAAMMALTKAAMALQAPLNPEDDPARQKAEEAYPVAPQEMSPAERNARALDAFRSMPTPGTFGFALQAMQIGGKVRREGADWCMYIDGGKLLEADIGASGYAIQRVVNVEDILAEDWRVI